MPHKTRGVSRKTNGEPLNRGFSCKVSDSFRDKNALLLLIMLSSICCLHLVCSLHAKKVMDSISHVIVINFVDVACYD